jgi:hypothetical protein
MNMGSFNFNTSGAAIKSASFKFDWEKSYLESTKNGILSNTLCSSGFSMFVVDRTTIT